MAFGEYIHKNLRLQSLRNGENRRGREKKGMSELEGWGETATTSTSFFNGSPFFLHFSPPSSFFFIFLSSFFSFFLAGFEASTWAAANYVRHHLATSLRSRVSSLLLLFLFHRSSLLVVALLPSLTISLYLLSSLLSISSLPSIFSPSLFLSSLSSSPHLLPFLSSFFFS